MTANKQCSMVLLVANSKFLDIWKYSLGSFSDDKTKPYDNYVVIVRSVILISYLVTNLFIISGVIRHWNSKTTCTQSTNLKKTSGIPMITKTTHPL